MNIDLAAYPNDLDVAGWLQLTDERQKTLSQFLNDHDVDTMVTYRIVFHTSHMQVFSFSSHPALKGPDGQLGIVVNDVLYK